MSFLTNMRVLTKILAMILVLSAATLGVATLGITSLKSLSDATDRMEVAAGQALDAVHLGQIVTAINKAEYSVCTDPRAENRAAARKKVDEQIKLLNERLASVSKTVDEKTKKHIAIIKQLWSAYAPELEDTFKVAETVKNFQMSDELSRLRASITSSEAAAEKLTLATHNAADSLNERVHQDSADATALYQRSSYIMLAVSGIAVVLGLVVGFIIGQFGIARPLRQLVNPLDEIAGGNFAIDVPGVGRKDEVGQIASSVSQMAEKVRSTISDIKSSGREVSSASAEIATSTTDLSQRTEEQAASLEQTSAAMEELSATVRKNAENAQQANQSANATRDVADRGGQVVAKAVEAMAKIEELVAEDIRHYRCHRRDCAPDQFVGAQRSRRSSPRRRSRSRLRRGRFGSA